MNKLAFVTLILLTACQREATQDVFFEENIPDNPGFIKLESSYTGIDFINSITNKEDFNIFSYRNFYNGGGVAIGDINNDGLEDIYFTSNQGENKLYLNKGNFQFEDITKKAGVGGTKAWSTGVTFVDINQDGLLDIYVCNAGNKKGDDQKNELFINQGDLTFTEEAAAYGLDDDGFTTHAVFFDYDNDGDLDVYILNNSFIPVSSLGYNNKRDLRAADWNLPEDVKGGGDKLLQNRNGKFVDVSEEAGIFGSLIGFGLGVTVGDINNNGFKDIYVSNDFYERDYLYINQGNGTFIEDIINRTKRTSLSSMGADMADINNDGSLEIFSTDMLPEGDARLKTTTSFENFDLLELKRSRGFYNQFMQNALQLNDGHGYFKEIALFSGVAKTDWSWGALFFDMNNNSYKDLYVSNGIKQDLTNQDFIDFFADEVYQKMAVSGNKKAVDSIIKIMPSKPIPNYAFLNNGNLTFQNKAYELGMDIGSFSSGAAYGDLNNNGKLDLVVNNIDAEPFIFQNNTEKNNYLSLKLTYKKPNIHAIGTVVKAFVNNQILLNEVMPSRGFQSSVAYPVHIGLAKNEIVDSIQIIWPNHGLQTLKDIEANQSLQIIYDEEINTKYDFSNKKKSQPLLKQTTPNIQSHKEDFYIDFDYEGLVFKMQSKEGPCIAVGDINGNGKEEVFIGGAKDQSAQLFDLEGNDLTQTNATLFNTLAKYEDTACALVDIDNDGHLDLIIGTGGNFKRDTKNDLFKIHILKNNGKGNFELTQSIANPYNTAVIIANDVNKNGYQDLFVGNFSVPGTYGLKPKSKLFINDGTGIFTDETESQAFDFKNLGMVKDAIWHDFTGNGVADLVVVGEWMHPMFFENNNGEFSLIDNNLSKHSGMFNAVFATDVNNDGNEELVFGNYGLNFKLQASKEEPVKMFVNDFDDNGTIEQIITRSIDDRDVPYIMKNELAAQIPQIKKNNISYKTYANQSVVDLFGEEKVTNSVYHQLTEMSSFVAFKEDKQRYRVEYLPKQIQWSSVHAITSLTLGEENLLFYGGNFYHFIPRYASLDASDGCLIGFDKNGFYVKESSLKIDGEIREAVTTKNNKIILARNNRKPLIISYEE